MKRRAVTVICLVILAVSLGAGLPAAGRISLAGVWMGLYIPYGQYAPQERYLVMYEDGTFYHDLPLAGLAGFDRDASRKNEKDNWGVYTFDGTSGTWKYNRTTTGPTALKLNKDSGLEIGSDAYYRCAPVDGLHLKGAWTTYANPQDPALGRGGIQPILRFTADRKFQDEGLFIKGFASLLRNGASEDERSLAPGKGVYEIKDFTLLLRYDDGRIRKAAFSLGFKSAAQSSPGSILLYRTRMNRI